jgi:flagellar hook assembly protein FlgD
MASTITFTAGTTTTVTNFNLDGTAGNLVTINSSVPGTQFTLYKASGTVNSSYLLIQDSNATGNAMWNANDGTNVNSGNNTGWNWVGGQFMAFF